MTKLLFQTDSYLKEFQAKVVEINQQENAIILHQTAFYPGGGIAVSMRNFELVFR